MLAGAAAIFDRAQEIRGRKNSLSALNRHEEFEQVLRGMRDRLVSVSEEVSQALTKANWHAETAPPQIRGRVQAGIGDITHTQEWLHQRLAKLPEDPQERYAAMQEMLQVQFVAVQKVTSILDELLSLRNKPVSPEYLPPEMRPQLPAPSYPQPASPFGPLEAGAPIARDFAPALATPATVPLFGAPAPAHAPLFPLSPDPQMPPQQAPLPPLGPLFGAPHGGMPGEPQWGPFPQAFAPNGPQAGAPLRLADLDPAIGMAQQMPPVELPRALTGRPAERTSGKGKAGRKYARPEKRSRVGLVTIGLLAAIVLVAGGGYMVWSQVLGGGKPKRVAIGDPSARNVSGTGDATPPVRSVDNVATRVPQAPPMSAPPLGDDFVPVIATHREKDGLTNIFMDLRKQYPQIVAVRKAIAQTVNLGSDGIWYQLVLLPPGPREQAESICEELRRAGYTRCAVRPNKP
jgi:hypothetical protein